MKSKNDFLDLINREISVLLKICPICEMKSDILDKRTMCITCERNQKIDKLIDRNRSK